MRNYTAGFKEAVLKKVFIQDGKSVSQIACELGVPKSTIFTWVDRMKKKIANEQTNAQTNAKINTTENILADIISDGKSTAKFRKPFNKAEKLEFVIQYFSLSKDSCGEFLRKYGLYSADLELWKSEFIGSVTGFAASKPKSCKKDLKKIKLLEHDLRRKDKALAEASALLILKKKADLLWGKSED